MSDSIFRERKITDKFCHFNKLYSVWEGIQTGRAELCKFVIRKWGFVLSFILCCGITWNIQSSWCNEVNLELKQFDKIMHIMFQCMLSKQLLELWINLCLISQTKYPKAMTLTSWLKVIIGKHVWIIQEMVFGFLKLI